MSLATLLWSFEGRISRGEFWLGLLLSSVAVNAIAISLLVLSTINSGETEAGALTGGLIAFGTIVAIPLAVAVFAICIKRFHDLGRSGWWSLILFVPVVHLLALIECGCREGMRESNTYGSATKGLTRKQRRLTLITGGLTVCSFAVALVLVVLGAQGSLSFFATPTEMAERTIAPGTRIRLGGLVKTGSLVRGDGLHVRFEVTDGKSELPVVYQGVLPDLFREGQGVVAEGTLDGSGVFDADTILAKHDETYMPKEVADALKKSGHWKDDYAQKATLPVAGADK
jgi:cytochrome c-type biogenesis protein CcmE